MKNFFCPFCRDIEPKSRVIEETESTFTILSNPALVEGHLLIVPKRHVEKLSELNDKEKEEVFSQIIRFQEKLLRKFNGCDIRQHYRPFQKQDKLKVDHLHIHLQPREFGDELYKKCQIFEKQLFRQLSRGELDELKKLFAKEEK
jgi:histidine triad (HIT) family protein